MHSSKQETEELSKGRTVKDRSRNWHAIALLRVNYEGRNWRKESQDDSKFIVFFV